MADAAQARSKRLLTPGFLIRLAVAVVVITFVLWRIQVVLFVDQVYGLDSWVRFAVSGIILGGVYAVIALGYTLVYGILFMINFAHGDVMMLGAFAGYFTLEAFQGAGFLTGSPLSSVIAIVVTFAVGMSAATIIAVALERIAYRPLRRAPRLV